jgi:phage shock protein A
MITGIMSSEDQELDELRVALAEEQGRVTELKAMVLKLERRIARLEEKVREPDPGDSRWDNVW